jgi:hypothetical protein
MFIKKAVLIYDVEVDPTFGTTTVSNKARQEQTAIGQCGAGIQL